MSIKGLFFSLVLYISLIWVAAAKLHSASTQKMRDFGLLWTAVGLSAVLAFIIGSHALGWIRVWRARKAARPKPLLKPEPALHADDPGLSELLAEAEQALAKIAPPSPQASTARFGGLPLFLLIGPDDSGKTSTVLHSGTDPQLLAGQAGGTSATAPTRLCNVWLVRGTVFIELGGSLFSGDLTRWKQALRAICGDGSKPAPTWRIWRKPNQPSNLHAVVAFCDVKNFIGTVNADQLVREAHHWQERLAAIGEVFGAEYSVHQIFSKTDNVTYFQEFFSSLPQGDAQQVFGTTLSRPSAADPLRPELADAEAKRLTRSFNALYQALVDRRLTHLAHEGNRNRRPAIYEFPREFKRLRAAAVEFMTDVYRPRPLHPGPVLCGFYLTATREVEAGRQDLSVVHSEWKVAGAGADATRLFRVEATQLFRPEMVAKTSRPSGTTRQWLFTSEVFRQVVLQSAPARRLVNRDAKPESRRRLAAAAVCVACGLLAVAWIWSWFENRALLQTMAGLPPITARTKDAMTVNDLRALEALRAQVEQLTKWSREGAPLRLRWGMYTGNDILPNARDSYFRRLRALILDDVNGALVAALRVLPTNPPPNTPYDPAYRLLATHLMTSSAGCTPDPMIVSGAMKQIADSQGGVRIGEAQTLIHRQVDYYASELPFGNPVRFTEDADGRDRARRYLANVQGVDRVYAAILASAEKSVGQARRLADLAPNYASVLNGGSDVRSVFTKMGWQIVEKKSGEAPTVAAGDPCVVGSHTNPAAVFSQTSDVQRAVQKLFVSDYIEQWRKFLSSYSVVRYRGPADAAEKLSVLARHDSPLLAVFALTADETDFPLPSQQDNSLTGKVSAGLENIIGKAKPDALPKDAAPEFAGPANIMNTFQPVHAVVPPRSPKWVLENNAAYVDALSALSASLRKVADAPPADPAAHQAAAQAYDHAMDAARQLARKFNPLGVAGIDAAAQRLLEEPVVHSGSYIERDLANAGKRKVNGELSKLCQVARSTLSSFPFNPNSDRDAGLAEMGTIFAPGSGTVWKFHAQSLAELVVKDGNKWIAKDPQVAPAMVEFLNRAQAIADVFYSGGATQPHLTFSLRPNLDDPWKKSVLEVDIHGVAHRWTTAIRKDFAWPPSAAAKDLGAVVRVTTEGAPTPVASRAGLWGIFRVLIVDAEPRAMGARTVEWRKIRGARGGRVEEIPPVRADITEFPGGVDVFNAKFFEALQCPSRAVQ
jgi:type VI secretion system protein ImpL